ncbi:MAG TPA: HEAT repeat domain-containing protein [Planctomycetota bacterium]|nr:HEAT repeat domain-containing protein [Planctomycetota bacterium]
MHLIPFKAFVASLGIAALSLNCLLCAAETPTLAVDTRPQPNVAPSVPTAGNFTVLAALEALADEDAETRARALAFLQACSDQDIPAFEAACKAADPDVRTRAAEFLAKVKRGEVVAVFTYENGTPAAKITFTAALRKIPAAKPNELNADQCEKRGMRDGGAAWIEVTHGDFTTDANGRLSLGRFADGEYALDLTPPAGFLAKPFNARLQLTFGAKPQCWTLLRGITIHVHVVDEAGQPVEGAQVAPFNDSRWVENQANQYTPVQILNTLKDMRSGTTDAKGAVDLENVDLRCPVEKSSATLAATREDCQLSSAAIAKHADGTACDMTLTLKKLVPVEVKFQLNARTKRDLGTLRLIAVPTAKQDDCIGADWMHTASLKNLDHYLATGAIDLGPVGQQNELAAILLPGAYMLMGFPEEGNQVAYNSCVIGSQSKTVPVRLNMMNINPATDKDKEKEAGAVRGKILCPPMVLQPSDNHAAVGFER